jgi:DNA-binding PucR family transcriptional regulator
LAAITTLGDTTDGDRIHQAVREIIDEDAAAHGVQPALSYHRGARTVAALPVRAEEEDAPMRLHEHLRARGWEPAIGVSCESTDLVAARAEAFACLDLALEAGAAVLVDGARLGPLRFMLDAPDCASATRLVHERLGALVVAEGRSRAPLLDTTRVYVEADGHQQIVARRCGIHVNTLKYRLARIEEILGYTVRDADRRFGLRVAFTLLDLLESLRLDPLGRKPGSVDIA